MIFSDIFLENETDSASQDRASPVDLLLPVANPNSEDGENKMAMTVELLMQQSALENAEYFENGDYALTEFSNYLSGLTDNDVQHITEGVISAAAKNNTIVQLNTRNDLKRRVHLSCLVLARENKDALWRQYSIARLKERKLRAKIFQKYQKRAYAIALKSQRMHASEVKHSAMPKFVRDKTGNKTTFAAVLK